MRLLLERVAMRLLPLLLLLAPLRLQLVLLMLLLLEVLLLLLCESPTVVAILPAIDSFHLAHELLLLVLLVRLLQQLLLLVLEFLLLLLHLLSLLIVWFPPRLRPAAQLRRGRGTVTPTMTRSISTTTPSLTNRSQAHPLLALLLQQVPLLPPLVSKIPRLRSLQLPPLVSKVPRLRSLLWLLFSLRVLCPKAFLLQQLPFSHVTFSLHPRLRFVLLQLPRLRWSHCNRKSSRRPTHFP